MVKRSTIGSILVAAALGIAAFAIIRKPRLDIPQSGSAQAIPTFTFSTPLSFSEPLPFKTIAQQINEFDFGIVRVPIASAGTRLRQGTDTAGGIGITGSDINRAGSKARNELRLQGFTDISVQSGVATAFKTIATNTFIPRLTSV